MMMESFDGVLIAHFESRMADGMEGLIQRHGGRPWASPAVSEEPIQIGADERAVIARAARGEFDVVVLLTGAGTRRLFAEAEIAGCASELCAALTRAVCVARGPKPVAALRSHGLRATHAVPEPNTTRELLATLASLSLSDARVLIVSAGETTDEPSRFLRGRGAHPVDLQLYRWSVTPSAEARLAQTAEALIDGRIAVALFTAQIQCRHLFAVADRHGKREALVDALRHRVLVGAVGPTCADALRERGVEPHVVPAHPKMGHLVAAAARVVDRPFARRPASAAVDA